MKRKYTGVAVHRPSYAVAAARKRQAVMQEQEYEQQHVPRPFGLLAPGGAFGMATGRVNRFQEVKALDVAKGFAPYVSTASVVALNLIQAGSSFFNRVGRRLRMKSIQIQGYIELQSVTGQVVPDLLRTVVVYDRQTNGAYPALADIFQDTDQTGANTTNELSGLNLNNRERFAILMDLKHKTPVLHAAAGVIDTTQGIWPTDQGLQVNGGFNINEFRKLRGVETHYKADSNPAVIGDISTGGLYLVTFCGTSGQWTLDVKTRLRYNDD